MSINRNNSKSKIKKKARDISGMSSERRAIYKNLPKSERISLGIFGAKRMQPLSKRVDVESEITVGRGTDNNAFIIIGNDRPGSFLSGYGGQGHTQCDAIDIVAGLGGHSPVEVEETIRDGVAVEDEILTNPNFFIDAARIYISQKTNIDKNFGIGEYGAGKEIDKDDKNIGKYGAKSAIAVKADNVRLIGRESLRLVTGTDKFNSQGGEVLGKSGIELVAMNEVDKLQPLVLGNNLQTALITIIDNIGAVAKILHGYMKYQMKFNQGMANHFHLSPFFALPTTISPQAAAASVQCDIESTMNTELSVLKHLANLQGVKHNFLIESGEFFINSRNNKCN